MINTLFGDYRVTAKLGQGGMGEVYRATDTKLDREVAIKVLPESFAQDKERLARFEREAKVLAALNHPNIAGIFGLEQSGNSQALVLELVEGEDLSERLKRSPLPVEEALDVCKQIAEALEAAHEKGIIHRDLKPGNVKLTADGKVKVLDFGLAKVGLAVPSEPGDGAVGTPRPTTLPDPDSPTLTADYTLPGTLLGTAGYMSPEQARGKAVNKRSDIWSFGVVLFECLTGRRLFTGETVTDSIGALLHKEIDWSQLPPETPYLIRLVLQKCLDRDPRKRLRDIGDLTLLLESAVSGEPHYASAPAQEDRRLPWAWVTATVTLLVVLATVLVFRPGSSSQRESTPALRYEIPLPTNALVFSDSVSPDGRNICIEAVENTEVFPIVLSLESGEFKSLPSAAQISAPFWSPDGRYIAYFSHEKLWNVSVAGGLPEEICDAPGLLGSTGTWGSGGWILFSGSDQYGPSGPLRKVRASGGSATAVPLSIPVRSGESLRYPVFLPDGRHFLFTVLGGAEPGIYVADLDAEQGRRVLPDISSAHPGLVAGADGMIPLLFARDGKLMAARLNLKDYELNGEPKVLRKSVHYDDRGALDLSLSRNGLLVYRGGSYRFADSRTAWFDRSGNELASVGNRGMLAPLSLSSTNGSYAYVDNSPGVVSSGDLWLYDLARSNRTRLTPQGAVMTATTPVWSPDEKHIVYTTYAANIDGGQDLFSIDAFTRKETALYTNSYAKFASDWSRDGRYVIFTELHPDTQADIWMLPVELTASGDLQAGKPTPVATAAFAESAGQVSPDGNWIAYTSDEVKTGQQDVFVQPFPPQPGGGKWRISVGDNDSVQPRWSPDGGEIYYFNGPPVRRTLMSVKIDKAVPESQEARAVFEVSSPKRLFEISINSYHPATGSFFYSVARDGERFLINFVDVTEEPVLKVNVNWEQLNWPEP